MQEKILKILDNVTIAQAPWECGEDIVTLDGKPIGATITRHSREFNRWWPEFKIELSKILAENLRSHRITAKGGN